MKTPQFALHLSRAESKSPAPAQQPFKPVTKGPNKNMARTGGVTGFLFAWRAGLAKLLAKLPAFVWCENTVISAEI